MGTLRADADGFLIGESMEFGQTLDLLRDVRADMRAILKQVRQANSDKPTAAVPRRPRATLDGTARPAVAARRSAANSADRLNPVAQKKAEMPARRRFAQSLKIEQRENKLLERVIKRLGVQDKTILKGVRVLERALEDLQEALERRLSAIGGGKGGDGFFKGALAALLGSKALGALGALGKGGGSLLGKAGLLLGGVLGARGLGGLLKKGLTKIPGLGAAAGAAGGGLLSRGKNLLGKIPLNKIPKAGPLGVLLGGFGLASAWSEANTAQGLTNEQRNIKKGGAVGEFGGLLAGGAAGAAAGSLLGPVGTVVGGLIGAGFGAWGGKEVGEAVVARVGSNTAAMANSANTTFDRMGSKWDSAVEQIKGWFLPAINALKSMAGGVGAWIKDTTGIDVGGALGGAWDATKKAAAGVASWATGGGADAGAAPATAAAAAAAGAVAGENAIAKIIDTGPGWNVVERPDGSQVKQEGARNWRNNNPGNIEYGDFAKSHGAIGTDGRFAIFPSYESGRAAKSSLIFEGKNYRDKSLTQAIARYAPAFENNTGAYQSQVLAAVGGQNKRMSEYTEAERTAILDAMERVEGFKVGKTTELRAATKPQPSAPVGDASAALAQLEARRAHGNVDVSHLDAGMASNLAAFIAEAESEFGRKIEVDSGYRPPTNAEKAATGSNGTTQASLQKSSLAASTYGSMHGRGEAVDLSFEGQSAKAMNAMSAEDKAKWLALAQKHNLAVPLADHPRQNEWWHVEPADPAGGKRGDIGLRGQQHADYINSRAAKNAQPAPAAPATTETTESAQDTETARPPESAASEPSVPEAQTTPEPATKMTRRGSRPVAAKTEAENVAAKEEVAPGATLEDGKLTIEIDASEPAAPPVPPTPTPTPAPTPAPAPASDWGFQYKGATPSPGAPISAGTQPPPSAAPSIESLLSPRWQNRIGIARALHAELGGTSPLSGAFDALSAPLPTLPTMGDLLSGASSIALPSVPITPPATPSASDWGFKYKGATNTDLSTVLNNEEKSALDEATLKALNSKPGETVSWSSDDKKSSTDLSTVLNNEEKSALDEATLKALNSKPGETVSWSSDDKKSSDWGFNYKGAVSTSPAIPSLPASPTIPSVAPSPSVAEPSARSGGAGDKKDNNEQIPGVGQDVRDRRIAHIVTGGIGAAL